MKIELKKSKIPTLEEILETLEKDFTKNKYEFKIYGSGIGKRIIVKKSSFIGAQIMVKQRKGRILISGNFGSPWVSAALGGLVVIAFVYSSWKKVEKDIFDFLSTKYE